MTDDEIIDDILKREGGFVNHKADKGHATNWGITQATLAEYRDHAVTVDDVKALTVSEARAIYREGYITKPGFHRIDNPKLRALVVDCAVHHGVSTAKRMMQRALRVNDDGVIGPVTELALVNMDPDQAYRNMCAQRAKYFGRIITDRPMNATFAAGWMTRLAGFIENG